MAQERLKTYDDFLGVDLSSSGGRTLDGHSAETVNVYKDYGETKGRIIETVPGFRKRFCAEQSGATDFFFFSLIENGVEKTLPIVHVKDKLYLWSNYPEDVGIEKHAEILFNENGTAEIFGSVDKVLSLKIADEEVNYSFDKKTKTITVSKENFGKAALISYIEKEADANDVLISGISENKLTFFVYGGYLYILDGERYFVFDGKKVEEVEPYIPTTYIGITAESIGEKLDEKNVLTDLFYNTFASDGENKEFYLSENEIEEIKSVEVYGENRTDYTVDLIDGKITFSTPIASGKDVGFEEGYSGIKVLAKGKENPLKKSLMSSKCAKVFEGTVVLSGAEDFGGIYYSAIDAPNYFPELNYAYIGGGVGKVTGLSVCANELFAYFSASEDGGIYKITSVETGIDNSPVVFSSEIVSSSEKIIFNGTDFLDLPTFLTSSGVFALASPNLKLERVVEKRSGLIDAKLLKLDLKNVKLFSFDGYFCIYTDGNVFMGDSRRFYRNEKGEYEFEWFVLSDIGSYKGAYKRFVFADKIDEIEDRYFLLSEKGKTANPPDNDGASKNLVSKKNLCGKSVFTAIVKSAEPVFSSDGITYVERVDEYVVEECEDMIGGTFEEAFDIKSFDGNVFFTTESGLFSFNFDKKGEKNIYNFDGRTIKSCVATKLDDLGFPDMKKTTIPKSLVVRLKSADNSKIKVQSRTESGKYKTVGEIYVKTADFSDIDFSSFSFDTENQSVYVLNDRTKSFLEKQITLSCDEYNGNIMLCGLSYRYKTVGRIKNKRRIK